MVDDLSKYEMTHDMSLSSHMMIGTSALGHSNMNSPLCAFWSNSYAPPTNFLNQEAKHVTFS